MESVALTNAPLTLVQDSQAVTTFRFTTYIDEEDNVHHQGIDDGGNGNNLIVEDKGTTCHGDGLCGILHPYLYDNGTLFPSCEVHDP